MSLWCCSAFAGDTQIFMESYLFHSPNICLDRRMIYFKGICLFNSSFSGWMNPNKAAILYILFATNVHQFYVIKFILVLFLYLNCKMSQIIHFCTAPISLPSKQLYDDPLISGSSPFKFCRCYTYFMSKVQ